MLTSSGGTHPTGCPTPRWCTCWCAHTPRCGAAPAGAQRAAARWVAGQPLALHLATLSARGRHCAAALVGTTPNPAAQGFVLLCCNKGSSHQDAGARGNNDAVAQPAALLLHPAAHEVLKVALLLCVGCGSKPGSGWFGPLKLQVLVPTCAQGMPDCAEGQRVWTGQQRSSPGPHRPRPPACCPPALYT